MVQHYVGVKKVDTAATDELLRTPSIVVVPAAMGAREQRSTHAD